MTIKDLLEKNYTSYDEIHFHKIDKPSREVFLRLKDFCTPKEEEMYSEQELINLFKNDLESKMKKYAIEHFGKYWVNKFCFCNLKKIGVGIRLDIWY